MAKTTRTRKGRPPQTVHGTIVGGNPATGESLAWSDGSWHGSKRLVQEAKHLNESAEVLPVPHADAFVEAHNDNPVAAYAIIATLVGPHGRVEGDIPTDDIARYAEVSALALDEFDGDL